MPFIEGEELADDTQEVADALQNSAPRNPSPAEADTAVAATEDEPHIAATVFTDPTSYQGYPSWCRQRMSRW
jgi:hypothetical protein